MSLAGRLLLLLCLTGLLASCKSYYFRHDAWAEAFAPAPPVHDSGERRKLPQPATARQLGSPLLRHWARQSLGQWPTESKVAEPRIVLARQVLDSAAAPSRAYLRRQQPSAEPGSKWTLHPDGDYDFTEITLGFLLAAPQLDTAMDAETRRHIATELIVERGSEPQTRMPGTLSLLRDTENHVLMREISRHLRMQWHLANAATQEEVDSAAYRRHAAFLHQTLRSMRRTGGYEFNSIPYMGYTLSALLVLHDGTALPRLRRHAAQTLDELLAGFVAGCLGERFAGPFRRQSRRAFRNDLGHHPALAMLQVWKALRAGRPLHLQDVPHNRHQALMALVGTYLPGPRVWAAWEDPRPGFHRRGHGPRAAPGTYTRGDGWLLAGGGSYRGNARQLVPQPIFLLHRGGPAHRDSLLHIPLPENLKANHTGVWGPAACAERPVHIPPHLPQLADTGAWQLVQAAAELHAAVYNTAELGVMVVLPLPAQSARRRFARLAAENPRLDTNKPRVWVNDSLRVHFKPGAWRNRWVVTAVNGRETLRRFDNWPREWHGR